MDENSESKNIFSTVLITLLTGLSLGFLLGILFAPKSGKETRREIIEKGEEIIDKSKTNLETALEKTKGYVETGKGKLAEFKSMGEELIEKSREKISSASKTVAAKAGEAAKKVDTVLEKGRKKAKEVEEELS